MTMSIAVVVILIAVTGFVIMKKNKGKNQNNSTPDTPASKPDDSSEQELESIMDSLLSLNILMRKDRDFPSKMTGEIEAVIDDLTMITPAVNGGINRLSSFSNDS